MNKKLNEIIQTLSGMCWPDMKMEVHSSHIDYEFEISHYNLYKMNCEGFKKLLNESEECYKWKIEKLDNSDKSKIQIKIGIPMQKKFIWPAAIRTNQKNSNQIVQVLKTLGYTWDNSRPQKDDFDIYTTSEGKYGYTNNWFANEIEGVNTDNMEMFIRLAARVEGKNFHVGEAVIDLNGVVGDKGQLMIVSHVGDASIKVEDSSWHFVSCFRKATRKEIIRHFLSKSRPKIKISKDEEKALMDLKHSWKDISVLVAGTPVFPDLSGSYSGKIQIKKNELDELTKKKIIGYKIKSEYKKFNKQALDIGNGNVGSRCDWASVYEPHLSFDFTHDSEMAKNFEEAGILDLWFEPVYENKSEMIYLGSEPLRCYVTKESVSISGKIIPISNFKKLKEKLDIRLDFTSNVSFSSEKDERLFYVEYKGEELVKISHEEISLIISTSNKLR